MPLLQTARSLATAFATAVGLLLTPAIASADDPAQYCVGNPTEFAAALDAARFDGPNRRSVIRMRAGTYSYPTPASAPDWLPLVGAGALEIRGGFNADCSARAAQPTRLVGPSDPAVRVVASFQTPDVAISFRDVEVEDLVLRLYEALLPEDIDECTDPSATFRFERVRLTRSLIDVTATCHRVAVRNSLFTGGRRFRDPGLGVDVPDAALAIALPTNDSIWLAGFASIVGSTFVNGAVVLPCACPNDQMPTVAIVNTVMQRGGPEIYNWTWLELRNNRFDTIEHFLNGATVFSADNLSVSANLAASGAPNPASPMVNSGTANVPFGLDDEDVTRGPRVIGPSVDRGAFETPVDGSGIYTVTTMVPTGPGSVFEALTLANTDPGPNRIHFNIPGACPRLIAFTSVFPLEVRDDLVIDGTTQPGYIANSSDTGFNGRPCVILRGLGTSGATGIQTAGDMGAGGKSLDIRGLAFENFEVAIGLFFGRGHSVRGVQIGGEIGSTGFTLDPVRQGIFVAGEGDTAIGGSALASANLIGDAIDAGIVLSGAVGGTEIIGNRIGVGKVPGTALPSSFGVRISSPNNRLRLNRIGGNFQHGVVIRGSNATDNVLTENLIGGNIGTLGLLPGNGGHGVFIDDGARRNRIGWSNTIARNGSTGIRISETAGDRNQIDANAIDQNVGWGIDIGAHGPDPISTTPLVCGVNGCPNGRANRPRILSAVLRPAGVILPVDRPLVVTGNLTARAGPLPYVLEFFTAPACRGPQANWPAIGQGRVRLGTRALVVPNQGFCNNGFCTASFTVYLPETALSTDWIVAATATSSEGNTSEFSDCQQISSGAPDAMFRDGFEQPLLP
jgi:hypothetical protein